MVVFAFVVVFVIVSIALVGVDNGGLDALIVISNTIFVIIAAVIGIIVGVRVIVGVVNLDNQLKLGRTSLIDVGCCYDVIVGRTLD
jgi:hypothetical protein